MPMGYIIRYEYCQYIVKRVLEIAISSRSCKFALKIRKKKQTNKARIQYKVKLLTTLFLVSFVFMLCFSACCFFFLIFLKASTYPNMFVLFPSESVMKLKNCC